MTATYRIRQGLRALAAFSQPVEHELAAEHLSPALLALFAGLRRSEQLHALAVLRAVMAADETPNDLAVAALLHDVGKSRHRVMIWQKTLAVLVRAVAPRLHQRLSLGNANNPFRRPFVVSAQHPEWSAELLREAGATETAIWLVAQHQDLPRQWREHAHFSLLQRLQQADDAN